MTPRFPIMALNLRRCASIIWSCARATALQEKTKLEWQPYTQSKVLNVTYGLLFWKEPPGTVEISQNLNEIELSTEKHFDHMFGTFLEKSFTHGPLGLVHYLGALLSNRAYCLTAVQEMIRDATSINSELVEEAHGAIQKLARIRLASALTLTGTGLYLTLTGAAVVAVELGAIKLATDVIGEAIKPGESCAGNSKGVAFQLGKYGAEKGGDQLADGLREIGEHKLKFYETKLGLAEERIERYSAQLLRRSQSRKALKISRRLKNAGSDYSVANRAVYRAERTIKSAKFFGKALPVIFAAWDVIEALTEYHETIEQAE